MPHPPPHQGTPNTERSPLSAAAVWQAVDSDAGQEGLPHQPAERSAGAFPPALARPLLALLSQSALPAALRPDATPGEPPQDDEPPSPDARAPSLAAFQAWIEQLLQDQGVRDTVRRLLQTYRRGSAPALKQDASAARRTAPGDAATDARAPNGDDATLLDTCATLLTPVLVKVLEAQIDALLGHAAPPPSPATSRARPLPLGEHLHVLSAAHYQAVRESLAQAAFDKVDGTPWPTARLAKGQARGHAQLRPLVTDQQPFMPPEEVERWTQIMWRQRGELSDLAQ